MVKPRPANYRSRRREITRDNTEPHQNANQQEKNTHPPENHGKGNETDHERIDNLGTCPVAGPMILPKTRTSPYIRTLYSTHPADKKTCSGLTHIGRTDAHSTPNQNPYPYVQNIRLE